MRDYEADPLALCESDANQYDDDANNDANEGICSMS